MKAQCDGTRISKSMDTQKLEPGSSTATSQENQSSLVSGQTGSVVDRPAPVASSDVPSRSVKKSTRKCRFFNTKAGCRAGDACPFLHVSDGSSINAASSRQRGEKSAVKVNPSPNPTTELTTSSQNDTAKSDNTTPTTRPMIRHPPVTAGRTVMKPVPKAQVEDPRAFQLAQLRRRFNPNETTSEEGATVLKFDLAPSDPDFPFDMSALQCIMTIPSDYLKIKAVKPSLRIRNATMPRGFQINVEKGFDDLLLRNPDATLLQQLNSLDRDLETLLTAPKADTVKIVVNARKDDTSKSAQTIAEQNTRSELSGHSIDIVSDRVKPVVSTKPAEPAYTPEQLTQAKEKREIDTRQLEARLGRLPLFSKYGDGVTYIVPIEPRLRAELPQALQAVRAVKLIVPALYNLNPCRIEFQGIAADDAARNVIAAFEKRARETSNLSLVGHVNYLSQNMHVFAKESHTAPEVTQPTSNLVPPSSTPPEPATKTETSDFAVPQAGPRATEGIADADRPHLITIQQPPEWVMVGDDDTGSETDLSYSYDSGDESDDGEEEGGVSLDDAQASRTATIQAERGIMISFPFLELHGIELLELTSIAMTVRCLRCKDHLDIQKLRNNETADYRGMRSESCKKCANPFAIGYRKDLMHGTSFRAGYLDLDGCTVVDLLPSKFIPTCSECSTPYAAPGVTAVRGDSAMAICRECHQKLTFRISEVKFLQVSQASMRAVDALPRKKKKTEKLGIVAGQELPRRGRCSHYSKSHRWFRFSCCSKVFACDRCHDEVSDHPNEHANRMICGYCSREQNYRPEDCGICRAVLVGKKGSGFWEGGKGTRDKARMSRKDPRKYKRKPGLQVGPGSSSKK